MRKLKCYRLKIQYFRPYFFSEIRKGVVVKGGGGGGGMGWSDLPLGTVTLLKNLRTRFKQK